MTETKVRVQLPPKLLPVFSGDYRYRGAYGGRGGGKTRPFALMSAVRGVMFASAGVSGVILCGREFQNSLEESSMEEVKAAIRAEPWLDALYDIGERYIRTKCRRVSFVFAGLRHNLASIKSKARILIAWIDEAEPVSESAWRTLTPTVREHGSEIWVTWNPESEESATHRRFRVNPPKDGIFVELNWRDNPWFPAVLEAERQRDLEINPDTYDHIWEGAFYSVTNAQVFANKYRVAEFEPQPNWDGPYQGGDFGFSVDPTAAVRLWIYREALYVEHEAFKTRLELDDTPDYVAGNIPDWHRYVSRWDSARPESISYLRRHGMPRAEAVTKWPGSVEDGVSYLRSFREIVVHPRCTGIARELRLYSYKIDKQSGDPLPIILDANNHGIDAMRYALGPMIRAKGQPRVRAL